MNSPYTDRDQVSKFEQRVAEAIQGQLQVGDYLKGSWPVGASVYLPPSGDGGKLLDYARQGHPGGSKLEEVLQAAEMGKYAYSFSDGMCAIRAAAEIVLRPGDTVFVHQSIYGGSIRQFNRLKDWGVDVKYVDLSSDAGLLAIHDQKPKLVFAESITNPLLDVLDLPRIFNVAKGVGAATIIDNTLATGYACVPLDIARHCDYDKAMVVLSLTKGYSAGELGGAVITNSDDFSKALFEYRQANGGNASTRDVPHHYEGLKTMGVRMERLSNSAKAIAEYLEKEHPPGIEPKYPLLKGSESYDLARQMLLRPPGVVTIECNLSEQDYTALKIKLESQFVRSNSFNGIFPQISESAKQSHASVKDQSQRSAAGIEAQLLRLSPSSLWNTEDLLKNFRQLMEDWQHARTSA